MTATIDVLFGQTCALGMEHLPAQLHVHIMSLLPEYTIIIHLLMNRFFAKLRRQVTCVPLDIKLINILHTTAVFA